MKQCLSDNAVGQAPPYEGTCRWVGGAAGTGPPYICIGLDAVFEVLDHHLLHSLGYFAPIVVG